MADIKEMSSQEARALLEEQPDVQLVDVREDWEWESGHLPGARHIPLGDIADRFGELDPEKPTYLVCAGGMRSYEAACFLASRGFADLTNLSEGTMGWIQRGFPVEG